MFPEAFTKLELEEVAELVELVNAQAEGSLFDPLETTILSVNVPYYPGYRFLDIADHATHPPLQRYALQKGKDFTLLNWSYNTVYALNERVPIALTEGNVLDYVRFFFQHVKGRHGRFRITEGLDSIEWKDDIGVEARKSFGQMIAPMKIVEKSKEGVYKIKAFMMLKETLFSVDVFVEPSGQITLSEHQIIVEEMPVLDEVFGQ